MNRPNPTPEPKAPDRTLPREQREAAVVAAVKQKRQAEGAPAKGQER